MGFSQSGTFPYPLPGDQIWSSYFPDQIPFITNGQIQNIDVGTVYTTSSTSDITKLTLRLPFRIIYQITVGAWTNNISYTTTVTQYVNGSPVGTPLATASLTLVYGALDSIVAGNPGDTIDLKLKTSNGSGVASMSSLIFVQFPETGKTLPFSYFSSLFQK